MNLYRGGTMPTYLNGDTKSRVIAGFSGRVDAGAEVELIKYVYPIPDDFTLTSHLPRTHKPWEKLHAGTLPVQITEGLSKFSQIEIINKTGAVVSVVANDDDDNARVIPDGEYRTIEHDHEIDALEITATGSPSGSIYVYGMRAQ
jgi:hypothetical protein